MITSIIAENSTDYIRRHITQNNNKQGFSKVWLCICKDGGDIKDIETSNSPQNLSIGLGVKAIDEFEDH